MASLESKEEEGGNRDPTNNNGAPADSTVRVVVMRLTERVERYEKAEERLLTH
jgi:hypothetical protein